jgi:hypothetical protein
MSVPNTPLPPEPPQPTYNRLGGCAATFLVLIGIVLLLPGICSLIFMGAFGSGGGAGGALGLLWLVTFGIAAGGIALIRCAIKNR